MDGGQTLAVGLDEAPPHPLQFGTPEGGDFRGYEVDLLEELSHRGSVGLRYRRAIWSRLVDELAEGKLDIICSAATVTPEWMKGAEFCRPHLRLTLVVVRRQSQPNGVGLVGERVGVRRGTTAETFVRSRSGAASGQLSESNEDLYAALREGTLDAVVDDSPIADHFVAVGSELKVAGILPDTEGAYGIMLRKGNTALRDRLDHLLLAMEQDGTIDRLRRRWLHEARKKSAS